MAGATLSLFEHPFFVNVLLPFLLIFTVVYAILEKTNILGEGKKSADIIVALIIGFIFVGAQSLVGFTLSIIPVIAVMLVLLLGYFLIFGFIGIRQNKGLNIALGIIFGIALIVTILWASGVLKKMTASFSSNAMTLTIAVIIIVGAIALITSSKKVPES